MLRSHAIQADAAQTTGLRAALHGPKRAGYLKALERRIQALPVLGLPSTRLTYTRGYYVACWALCLGALAWAWLTLPLWLAAAGFAVGYAYLQLFFMVFHVHIHTYFVEVPREAMPVGPFIAYVHHYEAPSALCLHEHTRVYLSPRAIGGFLAAFAVSAAWFGPVAIAVGSAAMLWWMMQGPVHEYYHLPKRHRAAYYSPPMRAWLALLARAGVVHLREHGVHHAHSPDALFDARSFDDMWVPAPVSRLVDRYWVWLQGLHRPGRTRMVRVSLGVMLAAQLLGAVASVACLAGLAALVG